MTLAMPTRPPANFRTVTDASYAASPIALKTSNTPTRMNARATTFRSAQALVSAATPPCTTVRAAAMPPPPVRAATTAAPKLVTAEPAAAASPPNLSSIATAAARAISASTRPSSRRASFRSSTGRAASRPIIDRRPFASSVRSVPKSLTSCTPSAMAAKNPCTTGTTCRAASATKPKTSLRACAALRPSSLSRASLRARASAPIDSANPPDPTFWRNL